MIEGRPRESLVQYDNPIEVNFAIIRFLYRHIIGWLRL